MYQRILKEDPFFETCLSIHLSCLVELELKTELYSLAHSLVNNDPKSPYSWYGVGCYYYCIKKYEQAKKHFQFDHSLINDRKAISLDEKYFPAHIGIGHSDANIVNLTII
jgi:anaphase-promoting complex subunit 6